jgi:hypothetical protein
MSPAVRDLLTQKSRRMPELEDALPSHLITHKSRQMSDLATAVSLHNIVPRSVRVVGAFMSGHNQFHLG